MNDQEHIETIHFSFTVEEDDMGPPPPNLISRFHTLNQWLTYIIDNEPAQKPIATYNIDVFEGSNDYTLCLTGTNTYNLSGTYQQVKIEFSPLAQYFLLPESEYKGLTRDQFFNRLTTQLEAFMGTDKFKNSFLTKAKAIQTSWKGEVWKNH